MAQQLGRPEAVTVIAIELKPLRGGVSDADSREAFARLLGGTIALACSLQPAPRPDGELAFTAVVPDTGQTVSVLRRMASIQAEFKPQYPEIAARFVVHHGLAFVSPQAGTKAYLGSALRSAHSQLQRLPMPYDSAATPDFIKATESWQACPLTFQPIPDLQTDSSLMTFSLVDADTPQVVNTVAGTVFDIALRNFLVQRLAAYVGPFAEVLVDAAQRSAKSHANLIKEVAHEIDDMPTRQRFEADAMAYLAAHQP